MPFMEQHECRMCSEQHPPKRTLGISVPVIEIPIVGYPIPYYLRFNGALCHAHTAAFTLNTFAEIFGPEWYELAADGLRARKKPATNPFPYRVKLLDVLDPPDPNYTDVTTSATPAGWKEWQRNFDFDWEDFTVNPNFEPAPKSECRVRFWKPETLAAKGAKGKLWR